MAVDNLSIILRILDDENRLVERADQKAISLLSILGVFMVFFVVYYRVIPINPLTVGLISLYFFFALLSIINLIMTIRPRIRNEQDRVEVKNNIPSCDPAFFNGICSYPNVSTYKESLQKALDDESCISDIYIQQIYNVAQINAVKYKYVQRGIILVITTLGIELVLITYLFIYHMSNGEMPSIF